MDQQQSKMARAGLGLSAKDSAKAAGIGYATLARFETGGETTVSKIALLRTYLESQGATFEERDGMLWVGIPRTAGKADTE